MMNARYTNTVRAVSLFTICCIVHLCLVAAPASAAVTANDIDAVPQPQANGTLKTTNNQPVIVNGNSVRPGTTILSGATIQTPSGVSAIINLGFATVDISPDSEVLLEFTADGNVKVTLKSGCVLITTQGSAQGTIISPDGSITTTGDRHRAEVCSPSRKGAAAATGGINKTVAAVLIVGGGLAALIIILATRGNNPSPSTP
jgi:hypothetical protein